jgi:hypothetical protein
MISLVAVSLRVFGVFKRGHCTNSRSKSITVIGKAGIKINEIRTQSQCHVRVTDPGTPATPGGVVNPGERLIIISGHPNNLNMAVGMLHTVSDRLGYIVIYEG